MRSEDKGNIGASIDLSDDIRPDALLFGETQSRIIITVTPENVKALEDAAKTMNTPVKVIGKVGGERLVIRHKSAALLIWQ